MNTSRCSGIYIHIPFCDTKCGYCDFYSITDFSNKIRLLEALKKEIAFYSDLVDKHKTFDTLYIGGGTPSVLRIDEIEDIISVITRSFRFHPDSEFTMEINPGTVDRIKLKQIYDTGIHRLSIGVQSFDDSELKFLGRIHTSNQARKSITMARDTGFSNINLDLIYALPDQTISGWETSLQALRQYYPEHISAYNLVFEEGTPFYKMRDRGEIKTQPEDQEAEFYNFTHEYLTELGYLHYEISNFARSEANISRHNYKYWQHVDYLAFGPSAHSFLQEKRWSNVRSVSKYISQIESGEMPVDQSENLDTKTLMFEYIFLQLRTYRGIDMQDFDTKFNVSFKQIYSRDIEQLLTNEYAAITNNHLHLTDKGMILCDEICLRFTA